jgi:beta-aspartyl-peptidase (threonine type)
MRSFLLFLAITTCCFCGYAQKPAIVIHGGAGNITKGMMSDSLESRIRGAMQLALDTGYSILNSGGTAMDAVETTISFLENSPYFNSGKGAVMTYEGAHELDASIMDGSDLNAGAVAGVTTVKNPIKAARKVMEESKHVLLSGSGAGLFAKEQGLELVDNDYFTTEKIRNNWIRGKSNTGSDAETDQAKEFSKFGTVGAVALDNEGNIAAGTSTGGMMNKRYGRIGDSPIIGAGTYADNKTCGVSSTGHGEYFIRVGVAKEISDQMQFGGKTLQDAAEFTIGQKLVNMNAGGGIVALDKDGNIEMVFNTPGMYRGYKKGEESEVLFYKEEE